MVSWVETLVRLSPIKHVAELVGLQWYTVKTMDHRRLSHETAQADLTRVRRQFVLHKGNHYAMVAVCADTQQVLWVGEGRSCACAAFEWLDRDTCQQKEAVAMGMNTAMDMEAKQHCPKARVVYDLFHVVAKFGREVIDRVRVYQANRLRENHAGRRVIKRSRWLLLRNRTNLDPEQAVKLDVLLAAKEPLTTVYLLKS
jgi:transposase|tara:strand:- start:7732 stop:8328 length:597 start_codon:yes stop_codon:yes gene_type:complete